MFTFYICAIVCRAYAFTYPWPVEPKVRQAGRIDFVEATSQLLDQNGLLPFLLIPLAVEVLFLFAAFLFLAWAAQPESIGQTARRTLHTIWLSSVTWVLAALLPLGIWQWNDLLRRRTAIYWPNTTTGRVIVRPDSPWILHERNAETLIYLTFAAGALWIFWAVVRALRTPTGLSCPILPPTCRSCGYNLSHLPESGNCPECGTSVASSVVRDGTTPVFDESPRSILEWLSFLCISRFTGLVPGRIFPSLPVFGRQPSAQRFVLFWSGALAMVVLAVPIVVQQWVENPNPTRDYGPRQLVIDLIPFALGALWLTLAMISGIASGFGLWQSVLDRRNQLPAAAKAAFYNAQFVAVWAVAAFAVYFFQDFPYPQIHSPSVFRIAQVIEANRPLTERIGQLVFLAIGLGVYAYLVRRAMREMRFANR